MKEKKKKHRVIIAIVIKRVSHVSDYSPVHPVKHIRHWEVDEIIRDEEEINLLLSINAPIEIFYRDE